MYRQRTLQDHLEAWAKKTPQERAAVRQRRRGLWDEWLAHPYADWNLLERKLADQPPGAKHPRHS